MVVGVWFVYGIERKLVKLRRSELGEGYKEEVEVIGKECCFKEYLVCFLKEKY